MAPFATLGPCLAASGSCLDSSPAMTPQRCFWLAMGTRLCVRCTESVFFCHFFCHFFYLVMVVVVSTCPAGRLLSSHLFWRGGWGAPALSLCLVLPSGAVAVARKPGLGFFFVKFPPRNFMLSFLPPYGRVAGVLPCCCCCCTTLCLVDARRSGGLGVLAFFILFYFFSSVHCYHSHCPQSPAPSPNRHGAVTISHADLCQDPDGQDHHP